MNDAPQSEGGLLATAQRVFRTLRNLLENRVELFLLELKEERLRLFKTLLLYAVGVACTGMALLLFSLTLVVAFWEEHRLLVLVLLTLVHAAGATLAFWLVRRRLQRWQAFSASIEQLRKDRECFETLN